MVDMATNAKVCCPLMGESVDSFIVSVTKY